MTQIEMVMPKMGESVMEGTILKWLKQVGDTIEQDESVLEVATDKVDTDVPAPFSGILKKILANEGDVVEVDKPIAIIETNGEAEEIEAEPEEQVEEKQPVLQQQDGQIQEPVHQNGESANNGFYSPLVMNIAKKEKISASELEKIPGTGNGPEIQQGPCKRSTE